MGAALQSVVKRTCRVCGVPVQRRYCSAKCRSRAKYLRFRPSEVVPVVRYATINESFWERVLPEPNSGCWLWNGSYNGRGYGALSWEGKSQYAHRFSYTLARGPIPADLELDHLCRTLGCCNPDHLEAVTHQVNVLRGEAPTARNAKKTHCPRGHPLTDLFIKGRGRRCETCDAARER
jgi:hypothetical protein